MKSQLPVVCASLLFAAGIAPAQDIAVRGDMVYPVTAPPIEDGVIVIENGKIANIGPAGDVRVPDGIEVLEAAVVTPGLIDAHSVVGLAGWLNQDMAQDQIEHTAAIQPELRAIDAYNPREPLIAWVRSFGVTTVHTGHAPGEIVSGQTLVAKTTGDTVAESVIVPFAMVAATLGEGAVIDDANGRKSPGNRSKAVAMLRSELVAAQDYLTGRAKSNGDEDENGEGNGSGRDLRLEALGRVLKREVPLLVTAHRHNDIVTALRIADEFDVDLVLDGAAEAYLVLDEIEAAGVPVIVHPSMTRAYGEKENISFTTPSKLRDAGIPFAFQSGFEGYVPKTRVVLFESAITLQHGLSLEQALAHLTIEAARILGIDERVGSLEPGKDGDLALYDGNPFEYTTHAVGTIIEGERVSDVRR
ncbi:MAG TPA: amidohydrolase family protein [Woeseiaceae bacterium]|nr:amidohydrolase family protein [Woeseiaceae bacterium]